MSDTFIVVVIRILLIICGGFVVWFIYKILDFIDKVLNFIET